ncbi:hypothetical protein T069G_01990 [Trichoderma breve]|uniref:Uncharacterized protein n=1 Tax=Trichoderma breve TaxID=2034170 RepID=A0A9W9EF09_9HYPO|nr:hypothetical protein T069G_01990 [Trichoderma breve]KAJ4865460.1 hypothetical protein T069G_01990 [Trichoderma breve]
MASYLYQLLGMGPKRSPPTIVPTDEIAPLHLFDDTTTLRGFTLMWTFKFDEVLNADMLGDSLSRLFQMEGWRKLGGRLRLRPDGSAEIHIPRLFTEGRPPLYFTKESFGMRISEHPEASKLPSATDKLTTFPSARNYQSLALGPGAPKCIDDYFYSDHPIYGLHVVNFTDATLVSINFNHCVSDLAGLMAVLNAWQLVLAGKPEAVPPFKGFFEDTMAGLYKSEPTEKFVLADKQLSGFGLASFGLRLIFDSWWNSPIESKLVCIPKKVMDAFVQDARDQISKSEEAAADSPTFITLQAVDPRSRVKSVFQQDAAYVCNAPAAAFVQYTNQEAVDKTIGELALESRKALLKQLTEEQMKAVAALAYKSMGATGNPPMFGESNMAFLVFSNWSKAAFLETVDFSPAIVKSAETARPDGKQGRPIYYHSQSIETSRFSTNVIVIMGRDLEGNFWLNADYPAHHWPALLEQLERYA